MRVFKQKYTDRKDQTRESSKWYVEFKDHNEIRRRLPGFTDRGATKEIGRRIEKLVALQTMKQPDDSDTTAWLESLPTMSKQRLGKFRLLDRHAVAHTKPLSAHLDDYISRLRNNGRYEDYVKPTESRIRAILV